MIIPWPLVTLIDKISWYLGYTTYVRAQGGPGWHMGRIGAERMYFMRRRGDEVRVPKAKAWKPGDEINSGWEN